MAVSVLATQGARRKAQEKTIYLPTETKAHSKLRVYLGLFSLTINH